MNWDKVFEYARTVLYGAYGHPERCVRCDGTGYITVEGNTCQQCEGYGYQGPNASGFMLSQIGFDNNIIQNSVDTDKTFRNKVWSREWWVTPTPNEVRRYFAHFARIQPNEIEIDNIDRVASSNMQTGIEVVVDVKMPYNIPLGVFSNEDIIWNQMAQSIEPAGIQIRFSFLATAMTGVWEWEDWDSRYMSGYISGSALTPTQVERVFGFYNPIANWDFRSPQGWYSDWGDDFMWFNHLDIGTHDSGYVSGNSGIACISGASHSWENGSMTGAANEWLKWAWPSIDNADDDEWHTGTLATDEIVQEAFWVSGTYIWDNFWASGGVSGFVGTARVVSGIVY